MPRYVPPPAIQICQLPSEVDNCEIENGNLTLLSQPRRRATRRKSTPSNFAPLSTQYNHRGLRRTKSTGASDRVADDSLSDEDQDEIIAKEDRQQTINRTHPFGIRVWNLPLYHQGDPGADGAGILIPDHVVNNWTHLFNMLWTLMFGWWLKPAESSKPVVQRQWSAERILFSLALHVILLPAFLIVAALCWCLVLPLPMAQMLVRLSRNLRSSTLDLSFKHDSSPILSTTETQSMVLLYNHAFIDVDSWKYSFGGVNILLINLMAIATLTGFDWLILMRCLHLHSLSLSPSMLFFGSLLGIIPLAYAIGQAVASISTQSSMGISAAVNAMFSTVFEVIFYCVALKQGKSKLVEGCIIGSILAGVLFLPGLSMCFGALKRKTQRFNSKSAGVTSTMLLFAMVGVFSPKLFYAVYGTYVIRYSPGCRTCSVSQQLDLHEPLYTEMLRPFSYLCAFLLLLAYIIGLWFTLCTHSSVVWSEGEERCHNGSQIHRETIRPQRRIAADSQRTPKRPSYSRENHRTSSWEGMGPTSCDVIPEVPELDRQTDQPLPEDTAPATPSRNVEQIPVNEESLRHVPNWSRGNSLLILLTATVFYCLLAVILIDAVDTILQEFYVEERFLGLTIFALIPNATEVWNAILFAVNGNIALSVEIGSAYTLQVCLLQIPALVFFSAVFLFHKPQQEGHVFSMVLPQWDMFVVIFSVFLHGYMQNEGRSKYFKGTILLLSYMVIMVGFFLSGERD
ncbi:ynl321w vnx1 calcium h+ antiporter localized to the endoplasmic reticulum membrane [Fusarium sporotrichioides]|uniref:Ynl321w vnx1 calcium h+ antiporter localized to the endoplasmic reticulum membrane n=1 Tax=Fusarium sporotrichioides TaxID=5514 RepID=A0A395SFP8_FUSSP|nr:ynl321w vnx1 calcium h+ antiporter localized to the endoplasmic reticulum membrane [Fusarium sporotrichioides]